MKKLIAFLRRWMATRRRSRLALPSQAEIDRVNAELAALASRRQREVEVNA